MALSFVLIGPATEALEAALLRAGHRALRAAGALAPWRGRMAAADAVVVDAGRAEAAEALDLARASTGGLAVALLPDGIETARRLSAGAGPAVPLIAADLVLSAAGGLALGRIERAWRVRRAVWFPPVAAPRGDGAARVFDLVSPAPAGVVPAILLAAARSAPKARFAVLRGGAAAAGWPANVEVVDGDAATLCRAARWSLHPAPPVPPGVVVLDAALLDAAAAGAGLLCEPWPGLGRLFAPGLACLPVRGEAQVEAALALPEAGRMRVAAASSRIAAGHSAERRAAQLARLVAEALAARRVRRPALSFAGPPAPAGGPARRVCRP